MSMILEIAVPDGTDIAPADLFEAIKIDGNRVLLQRVFRRVTESQPAKPKTLGISVSDSVGVKERIIGS